MKFIILLSLIVLNCPINVFAFGSCAQQADTTDVFVLIKENTKEWRKKKGKLFKKITYDNRDSTEIYMSDNKGEEIISIMTNKIYDNKKVEHAVFYYLNGQVFQINYFFREKGAIGIWRTKNSCLYFFEDDKLIYKGGKKSIHQNISNLLDRSKMYFRKSLELNDRSEVRPANIEFGKMLASE